MIGHGTDHMNTLEACQATLAILASREAQATVCPSEVARFLAASDGTTAESWREKMPDVHAAVDALLSEGLIRLSWKGKMLIVRSGPYRIRSAD